MERSNFCEFIKGIHTNPFALVKELSIREYYALQKHVQVCENCAILIEEVYEKYGDAPPDPNLNDGRFN
jgi:hypothetical protein